MYVPTEYYLWAFWIAPRRTTSDPYHLFHLQAPRSLEDSESRHWVASIGHATSHDLVNWTPQPTAFMPSMGPAWDDKAIWTGSKFDAGDCWYFYYTALSEVDDGHVQRIGLARSTDLTNWTRYPGNPILDADSRWLHKRGDPPWEWESFRDPWVIRDPTTNRYLMFLTASAADGEPDAAGVIALAESTDLIRWQGLPPVTVAGDFGELEVPQVIQMDSRWYLFFCTGKHSISRRSRLGDAASWVGTHYMVADSPTGLFRPITDEPLVADGHGTYYAGRVVPAPAGGLVFMAWRKQDEHSGEFIDGLSNPAPLVQRSDGTLAVDQTKLWDNSGTP